MGMRVVEISQKARQMFLLFQALKAVKVGVERKAGDTVCVIGGGAFLGGRDAREGLVLEHVYEEWRGGEAKGRGVHVWGCLGDWLGSL